MERKTFNVEKSFTYLRGFFKGAKMSQSLQALGFARDKHKGYTRKGGEPYLAHPLWMASYAVAIGCTDDSVIAAILLHDVPEDTGTPLSSLPVSDLAREIVDCMTIKPYLGESKWECKKRYYHGLLQRPGAVICKGIDRYHNLSTMPGVMPVESIQKNVIESYELLLPVMREAKEAWPELSDIMFVLRANISNLCYALDIAHNISEQKDAIIEKMKNTPAIGDTEAKPVREPSTQ